MDLERLIATEQRLDEALHRAKGQSETLRREAEAAAQAAEAKLDAELEATARAAATRAAAARRRAEQEVASRAAVLVARYQAVSDRNVARAAERVVRRLVGEPAA